jgi:hypothetical protein
LVASWFKQHDLVLDRGKQLGRLGPALRGLRLDHHVDARFGNGHAIHRNVTGGRYRGGLGGLLSVDAGDAENGDSDRQGNISLRLFHKNL